MDPSNPVSAESNPGLPKDDLTEAMVESSEPAQLITSHPPPPPRLRARAAAHEGRPIQVSGEPRLARDLMTRQLFTIGPDDLLESLEERMEEFRFRHLPVVEGERLVGLITRSDLLHLSSSVLSVSAPEENVILHRLTASRVMKRDCTTTRPSESLSNVAALIWQSRIGCVPVTEEDGTLVGIITEGDFVRLAHHFLLRGEEAH
jgi:CBS domain-containing membrane protein